MNRERSITVFVIGALVGALVAVGLFAVIESADPRTQRLDRAYAALERAQSVSRGQAHNLRQCYSENRTLAEQLEYSQRTRR